MVNPVEFVGGAILGTTFSALYAGVEDLVAKNHMFRNLFKNIRSGLDTLKPLIAEMTSSNQQLSYTNSDELQGLEAVLKVGEALLLKCSNVRSWDLYRKYKYATKLLAWEEDLGRQLRLLQVSGFRDGKKTAVAVENIEVLVGTVKVSVEEVKQHMKGMIGKFVIQDQSAESKAWCAVPELPVVIVGQEAPLKNLKSKLLGDDGVSMLVLTAPGGCGKTTLATNFCRDQEVKDKFGENIFFVTVSKQYSLNSIVEQLYRHKGSDQVPALKNETNAVQWLETFLKEEGNKPLLFVFDDVWNGSESLLEKFDCKRTNIKILVTSRSEFRAFGPPYHLEMLAYDDAMKLFHHSASLGDMSSHIPPDISRKIVERCKGFPLAITVVGRSLRAQPIEMWRRRLSQWSKGNCIFDFETDLLFSLQTSLDALDKDIKECFLDLGSFTEDKEIPFNALIDIWSEIYDDMEDNSCFTSLYELNNRCLAKLVDTRAWDGEGYYDFHYVTQHDLLRELATYHSKLGSAEQRKRLIIDICGSNLPKWWREQKCQVFKARLLSITTDGESSTLKWPDMHLPEAEALVLNLRKTDKYALPEFVEKMEKLKVLVITAEDIRYCEVSNLQQLSFLSNLKRMRLENISISSKIDSSKNSMQIKSLRKLSLIGCNIHSVKLSHAFPNLEEMYTDASEQHGKSISSWYLQLCDMITLKKLTIIGSPLPVPPLPVLPSIPQNEFESVPQNEFGSVYKYYNYPPPFYPYHYQQYQSGSPFPDEIGQLVNLEVLRLRSIKDLSKLPDSMKNLKKLNFLGIVRCDKFEELPEHIGEMRSLTKIDTRDCRRLKKLPQSVLELKQLEEVICDESTKGLWRPLLPSFRDRNQDTRVVIAPTDSLPNGELSSYHHMFSDENTNSCRIM